MPEFCANAGRLGAAAILLFSAGALAQTEVRVVVADAACETLAETHEGADVSFRPGVDVRGRPVVAADLPGSPLHVPMPITFDVTIDVAARLGLRQDTEALLKVAQVSERNGEILINGYPASELGRTMVLQACRGQLTSG